MSCAKLNFLASPRFGTVREFLRMLSSPTLRAISLRLLGTVSLLLTRVIVNRSIIDHVYHFSFLSFCIPKVVTQLRYKVPHCILTSSITSNMFTQFFRRNLRVHKPNCNLWAQKLDYKSLSVHRVQNWKFPTKYFQ